MEHWFDDLARAQALRRSPVRRHAPARGDGRPLVFSRRQGLKAAVAGALALGPLSGLIRPGRALAHNTQCSSTAPVLCDDANHLCCTRTEVCCPGSNGGCCPPGTQCGPPRSGGGLQTCIAKCDHPRHKCGDGCCDEDEDCIDGTCSKRCPGGRSRCAGRCCKKGHRCDRGRCRKCPKGRRACGKKCCPPRQDCCFDNQGNHVCCDTRKRDCCSVGAPGSERITCCAAGTTCARMIQPGQAGVTSDSPRVCCSPDRVVPLSGSEICCPPGTKSLGGKLVVPAGGGGGLCCRGDKICGSGAGVTCCGSAAGFEQKCVDGRCVAA